jgi:hypothetical protein
MRRRSGVSRPISAKPGTCTARCAVYLADISVKVARITRGDLAVCRVLPTSRGVGMRRQKSAEAIVGVSRSRRAEREVPRVGGGNLKEADEGRS